MFISCSATVSSMHNTCPEITTRLTTMTLYSRHPSPRPTHSDPLKTSNSFSSVRLGLAKSYLINAIRQLFTDRAATSTLEVTALTRIPRQHSPWAIMRFRPGHSGEFECRDGVKSAV